MGVRRVLAAFLSSDSSLLSKKERSASRREKGPRLPRGGERASSRWTQIAQQNCSAGERTSAGGSSAGARLRLRARDLAKRGESQGGRGGSCERNAKTDHPTCLFAPPLSSLLTLSFLSLSLLFFYLLCEEGSFLGVAVEVDAAEVRGIVNLEVNRGHLHREGFQRVNPVHDF
jgi:hypothetical protein